MKNNRFQAAYTFFNITSNNNVESWEEMPAEMEVSAFEPVEKN